MERKQIGFYFMESQKKKKKAKSAYAEILPLAS